VHFLGISSIITSHHTMSSLTMGRLPGIVARRCILQCRSRYATPTQINAASNIYCRAMVQQFTPTLQRHTICSKAIYSNTPKSFAMGNRNSSTAVAAKQPESVTKLFNEAEANLPSRFREHGWYLTVVTICPLLTSLHLPIEDLGADLILLSSSQ